MKMRFLMAVVLCGVLAFAGTALAGSFTDDFFDDESRGNTVNLGVDSPYAFRLTDNGFVGAEVWKQLLNSNGDNDFWFGIKYTNNRTWKDFRKKDE